MCLGILSTVFVEEVPFSPWLTSLDCSNLLLGSPAPFFRKLTLLIGDLGEGRSLTSCSLINVKKWMGLWIWRWYNQCSIALTRKMIGPFFSYSASSLYHVLNCSSLLIEFSSFQYFIRADTGKFSDRLGRDPKNILMFSYLVRFKETSQANFSASICMSSNIHLISVSKSFMYVLKDA